MSLLLNVPYSEKDKVKSLGARWNPNLKKWYITNKKDYHKFEKWFSNPSANLIICQHIYLAVAKRRCFKCNQLTTVVSLASDSYIKMEDESLELYEPDINFIQDISHIPERLEGYLNDNYKFYNDYSKFTHSKYLGNHCNNCGVLQGNFFLYCEPDSPFFVDSVQKARNLKIYQIELPFDLEIRGTAIWSSGDYMIKRYAEIEKLNLTI